MPVEAPPGADRVMNPEFHRVKELFLAALEKGCPAERDAYLGEACGGDAPLRRQVDTLLRTYEEAGSFLEVPPLSPTAAGAADTHVPEAPLTVIGKYRLLEKIGEGGM